MSWFLVPTPRKSLLSPAPSASEHWNIFANIVRRTNHFTLTFFLRMGCRRLPSNPPKNLIPWGRRTHFDPSLTNLIRIKETFQATAAPLIPPTAPLPFLPLPKTCGHVRNNFARNFTITTHLAEGDNRRTGLCLTMEEEACPRRQGHSKREGVKNSNKHLLPSLRRSWNCAPLQELRRTCNSSTDIALVCLVL